LTRGYEFLVDNSLDVKKNDQHWLDIAVHLTCLFQPQWIWGLPLWRLLLSLRAITIHPCFITSYDIGDEVGAISGLFEFPADRNAMGLLVVAQQSWHKFRRNMSHVQIVRQDVLNGPVWQSYYITNIMDSLLMICKDSLVNFCYVFRCCAYQQSSRMLIVIDRRSSIRPWSICTIKKFCFGSWHYLWRLPVAFSGFLQQFFKDWNKIWCRFFAS
jgi:hypothetical protein